MTMTATPDTRSTTTPEVLEVPVMDLHNAVKNIILFTAPDNDNLPVLSAAHFRIKDARFIIEATDRYRMSQIEVIGRDRYVTAALNGFSLDDWADLSLGLVDRGDLKLMEQRLRPLASKATGSTLVSLIVSEDKALMRMEAPGQLPMTVQLVDGEYPKIDSMFNRDYSSDEPDYSSFELKFFKDLATVRDWRETPKGQTIRPSTLGNKPALFHHVSKDNGIWAQSLLMPIRLPEGFAVNGRAF